MPGTKSRLTALELRKRLLLVESEVNRIQLCHEWQCLESETRELTQRAKSICATVQSGVALGIAGIQAVRDLRSARSKGKKSWLATILEGMRLGTSMWNSFRSRSP